jgi:hypothetical protein
LKYYSHMLLKARITKLTMLPLSVRSIRRSRSRKIQPYYRLRQRQRS